MRREVSVLRHHIDTRFQALLEDPSLRKLAAFESFLQDTCPACFFVSRGVYASCPEERELSEQLGRIGVFIRNERAYLTESITRQSRQFQRRR
jgi:hypothetical protein